MSKWSNQNEHSNDNNFDLHFEFLTFEIKDLKSDPDFSHVQSPDFYDLLEV